MANDLFPNFRPLQVQDRILLDQLLCQFKPIESCYFPTLFSYLNQIEICFLNHNLVLKAQETADSEIYYSLLGMTKLKECIEELFAYQSGLNQTKELWLIPAEMLDENIYKNFLVVLNQDYSTYVYAASVFANKFDGKKTNSMATHRRYLNNFKKNYPDVTFELHPLSEPTAYAMVFEVFTKWRVQRHKTLDDDAAEQSVLERVYQRIKYQDYQVLFLKYQANVIGILSYDFLAKDYVALHFFKYCGDYVGIQEVMYNKIGEIAVAAGYKYLLASYDLGIAGLRRSKQGYQPLFMIDAYNIFPKNQTETLIEVL